MEKVNEVLENMNIMTFETVNELHEWLLENEKTSDGIRVKIFKTRSKGQVGKIP